MIQTKERKIWMSFNFSHYRARPQRVHKENSSFSASQVTGLYLDFVKLEFVGSVSFICQCDRLLK